MTSTDLLLDARSTVYRVADNARVVLAGLRHQGARTDYRTLGNLVGVDLDAVDPTSGYLFILAAEAAFIATGWHEVAPGEWEAA